MTDVSLAGAFIAGLISFLSPCVLPLVPGYISMLSGIGVEQLRQGEQPKGGLFSSALSFVVGFSVVFIGFGASASAVGGFLQQHKNLLTPIAGALILLFGLHLLGGLIKMNVRAGIVLGPFWWPWAWPHFFTAGRFSSALAPSISSRSPSSVSLGLFWLAG